ncbi:MAG: NAD-dependent DNA ligase LigA [Chloroflexi bacterium]|nr:NAD-dependent DNA ligase LigA [Chloroflexota bacterium]
MTREEKLKKSIELHSKLYDRGKPLISDAEYDALVREYNELTGANSDEPVVPVVVGSAVADGSPKVAHPAPMLSLNNAFDQMQRAQAWHAIVRQAPGARAYADLKIDGMALRVDYENGEFRGAATRGDGIIGENVAQNAIRIADLPLKLKTAVPGRISVVGEAYIPNGLFALLNNDREAAGEELYSSPRNTVAGGMRHSDSEEVAKRGIHFFAYGLLFESNPKGFTRHSEVIEWLAELDFSVVEFGVPELQTEADIENAFETLSEMMYEVDYDCDGVVIKVDSLPAREILGAGRSAPNWAFACKGIAQAERTVLRNVSFSVGRTGAVTPIGEVEPVVIGDVTVTSVTLHNKDIVEGLDLMVGDKVLVKRAGDVIPAVEKVFNDERDGSEKAVVFPTHCPACASLLIRPQGEARIYCPNTLLCPGQLQRGLEHFIGQDYMAIVGAGPVAISKLIAAGLVSQISDLYRLTWDDLVSLSGWGEKKAENLLEQITASKDRPLQKLLAALGIREVGRSASETLVGHYRTLSALLDATSDEDRIAETYDSIRQLERLGPKMAESFCSYMGNPNNRKQLYELLELGVAVGSEKEDAGDTEGRESTRDEARPLGGMKVCATGKLQHYTRSSINTTIAALGGTAQNSVTKATDLLIAGEKAGSKLAKAQNLGIRVVTEAEFEAMVS